MEVLQNTLEVKGRRQKLKLGQQYATSSNYTEILIE
jgi:hypothetical protein